MFNTTFFDNVLGLAKGVKDAQDMAKGAMLRVAYAYSGTTGTDGLLTIDYSDLKLTKSPKIACLPRLAKADLPVMFDQVGEPTATSCTVRCRRITSALNLLVVSSFPGVANVVVDVYVRPVAT